MQPDIKQLLDIIERKLDWGETDTWQSKDFENLNQRILAETGVSLSASTLRRVWGRVEYNHLPSSTTLDALAKFAGFDSWRAFTKTAMQPAATVETAKPATITAKKTLLQKYWVAAAILLVLLVAGSVIGALAFKTREQPPVSLDRYSFSAKRLTNTLPNSVVFTYDASASPIDSVFIQQSWDERTRTFVDKNLHQHTSVYFEPGYFDAKLLIGDKVVKEQPLIIPTDGWLATIDNKPVPIYLKQDEYLHKDSISCPIKNIQARNIPLQPMAPIIRFFNVGNFTPAEVHDFSFSADVKNEFNDGSSACQLTGIYLITDVAPVIMQLGVKGCASELNLMSFGQVTSGKKADLSGFGVDFNRWASVTCKSSGNKVQYIVNGQLAYEAPLPTYPLRIVGIQVAFMGTGAIKNIHIHTGNSTVFKAF